MSAHRPSPWLTIVLVLLPAIAAAQGGPPLITDDPDTPGPGFWEINLSGVFQKSQRERRLEAPFADINYGVGERIQLKFEIPWLSVGGSGDRLQTGLGDAIVGVKWRFLGQEGKRIAWSTYPQVEINTGQSTAMRPFVEQGPQLSLPTEITFQVGRFEINGELGRVFVRYGDDRWFFGVATEIMVGKAFELVSEVFGEQDEPSATELIVNAGGRLALTRQLTLLLAVGKGVRGQADERPNPRLFLGIQFNLPHRSTVS
jgi:hypothetical protein